MKKYEINGYGGVYAIILNNKMVEQLELDFADGVIWYKSNESTGGNWFQSDGNKLESETDGKIDYTITYENGKFTIK